MFRHDCDKCVTRHLGDERLDGQTVPLLINDIEREHDPDEHKKSTDVAQEMRQRVTLIPNRGKVIRTVSLAVAMFDMVVKVGVLHPSGAHYHFLIAFPHVR